MPSPTCAVVVTNTLFTSDKVGTKTAKLLLKGRGRRFERLGRIMQSPPRVPLRLPCFPPRGSRSASFRMH
ncbi:hypothetical protein OPQ81_001646 [Rhizoctonia solani]|nr:hypothetical protein OPQ81_001646 [Rhizoctonia solani]